MCQSHITFYLMYECHIGPCFSRCDIIRCFYVFMFMKVSDVSIIRSSLLWEKVLSIQCPVLSDELGKHIALCCDIIFP